MLKKMSFLAVCVVGTHICSSYGAAELYESERRDAPPSRPLSSGTKVRNQNLCNTIFQALTPGQKQAIFETYIREIVGWKLSPNNTVRKVVLQDTVPTCYDFSCIGSVEDSTGLMKTDDVIRCADRKDSFPYYVAQIFDPTTGREKRVQILAKPPSGARVPHYTVWEPIRSIREFFV